MLPGKKVTPIPADGGGIVPPANGGGIRRDEAETLVRRTKRSFAWPTKSGLTEARVRAECKKVLEDSKTGKACKSIGQDISHFIESCVIDVQVTKD